MKTFYQASGIAVILAALVLAGCASKGVAPVESITGAELAVRSAAEGNATVHAPLELRIAEDKLNAAKQAVATEEYEKAKRLADEALVNARLAEEKSRAEKAKKSAEEMRESIETLRREIERAQKPQ